MLLAFLAYMTVYFFLLAILLLGILVCYLSTTFSVLEINI
jgi:cytochrome b561